MIAGPLRRHAEDFEAQTGANVEVTVLPFEQFYSALEENFDQDNTIYDIAVYGSQWLVDFAQAGFLEDLSDQVQADIELQWDDVAPFFRDFSVSYDGKVYAMPLDGDFQLAYYRTDLLEEANLAPPQTWQDYLDLAKFFHRQDLNGDGQADFGSCIAKKRENQSHYIFGSIVSPFLQSQGTQQGAFFDLETMEPLVQNEAFAKALDIYKTSGLYGPPDELELVVADTRSLFVDGRCALTVDWGDIGTLAITPESKVVDQVSTVILPGTSEVLDRETGKLVACDKFICPYAINGVNYAPYAAFGGWVGSINAAAKAPTKEAAYSFLSYVSQPAQSNRDVTIGITGLNPYRISQFNDRTTWIAAGMSSSAAQKYLGGIVTSLNSPNMVLDLRIPANNRYQLEAMDAAIGDFLTGEISQAQTIQRLHKEWESITDELGRDAQSRAYRSSLGL